MNDEQLSDLTVNLKRAIKANKPWFWGYVASGDDGKAVLLVQRKQAELTKAVRAARKTAKDKKFATGRAVVGNDKNLVLGVEEGSAKAKLVKKALMLDVSKDPGVNKVKPLIRAAEVMETDAFEDFLKTAPVALDDDKSPKEDTGALRKTLAQWAKRAQAAFKEAKARVDGKSFEAKLITRTLKSAQQAEQGAESAEDLRDAIQWFTTLYDVCESSGRQIPETEDDGEDESAWLDDELDVSGVNAGALLTAWQEAMGDVDPQLRKLIGELKKQKNPMLDEIADKGINAMTAGFRGKLQGALIEAKLSHGDRQTKALKKAVSLADKFVDVVYNDERFEAVDLNEWTGPLNVRNTLGRALRFIANAA